MVVIFGRPPIFDRVIALVGADAEKAYFTWEGQIWSPSGRTPPPETVVHEERHVKQQERAGGSQPWWDRWLAEPEFRLDQEAKAYGAQIAWLRARRGSKGSTRNLARDIGAWIARLENARFSQRESG